MAIVYALISLVFAGVNDVVFRRYGRKPRPIGLFFTIVGIVWASVFLGLGALRGTLVLSTPTVAIGLLAGVFSMSSNIILVEAMKRTGATVAATIFRLNLVFVAVFAFVFLGEALTLWKLSGLFCAVAAVLLFAGGAGPAHAAVRDRCVLALVGASLLRAGMGISYKVASNHAVSTEVFLAINGLCWVLGGGGYAWLRRENVRAFDAKVPGYAVLSGLLICGIVLFMKLAVNVGDASVAVTVSQFSFLVTLPIAVLLFGERCTARQLAGVALAAACIGLFAHG